MSAILAVALGGFLGGALRSLLAGWPEVAGCAPPGRQCHPCSPGDSQQRAPCCCGGDHGGCTGSSERGQRRIGDPAGGLRQPGDGQSRL